MAQGKKSFTAYCDWKETFDALPNEKAGELIKHIFAYVNDQDPQTDDLLIKAVFAQIKATLKRDLKKWEAKREQNSKNAKKRWQSKQSNNMRPNANAYDRKKQDANNAVSVSDSDSVSDIKERESSFAKQVCSLETDLPQTEIEKFIRYWTEKNPRGKKMKFEKQKTFDPKRRLQTWASNYFERKEKSFGKKEKLRVSVEDFENLTQ